VYKVLFLSKGKALASCAGDRTVRLWPLPAPNETASVKSILVGQHLAAVESLAASPDSRLLASVANDGSIKLWNVAQTQDEAGGPIGSQFQFKPGPASNGLCSRRFLPDGEPLVGVSAHGTVGRNILLGKDCEEFPAGGACGALSPDGKLLATG